MKRTQTLQGFRKLPASQLALRIRQLRTLIDRARIDAQFGRAKNPHAVTALRHELAQALTLLGKQRTVNSEQPQGRPISQPSSVAQSSSSESKETV